MNFKVVNVMLKNRLLKTVAVILATAVLPVSFMTPAGVRADDTQDSAAIIADALAGGAHRCNVNAPRAGNVFIQLMGTFDASSKDAVLSQINNYRLEACQNGVPDPRNPGRGLTMSDYVPLTWSRGLEEMAMLRAAEASYTSYHLKTTGEDYTHSSYDVASAGEILGFSGNIASGLSQCYSEKNAWQTHNPSVSRNYAQIINPSYRCCGISAFNRTMAGEFSSQTGLDDSKIDVTQYNSQLSEINSIYVSGVTVTTDIGSILLNSTTKLRCVGNISVLGYSKRLSYSGIRILPTTWWTTTPGFATVDPVGNATGVCPGMAGICFKLNGVTNTATVRVSEVSPVRDFATRLYSVALTRQPDQSGLDYWTNRLASHQVTGTQAAYGFFFSPEFLNANLSNEVFVTRLYQTFLGRDPEAAGYNYWLTRLADGASRTEVFYGFSGSSEFSRICAYAGINP